MDSSNINESTLNRLKMRIFGMIRENHKTKKLSTNALNEKIRKTIEVVVDNDN